MIGKHRLRLIGVGLEAHLIEETAEGFEGPLEEDGVTSHAGAIIRVNFHQDAAHIHNFHGPVNFDEPHADNGVYHKVEGE